MTIEEFCSETRTVEETAVFAKMSSRGVYYAIQRGELQARKVSPKTVRLLGDDLRAWLESTKITKS